MKIVENELVDLNFRFLPAYASYIRKKRTQEFVAALMRHATELGVPLLKQLAPLPENEMAKIQREGADRMLAALESGDVSGYVEQSVLRWKTNSLPAISRDDIVIEDISLIGYARKKALFEFLVEYSN